MRYKWKRTETCNFQHTWIHGATHKTHKKGTRKQRSNNYHACFVQYDLNNFILYIQVEPSKFTT